RGVPWGGPGKGGGAMTSIEYLRGDATCPQARGVKIIAHVCNDLGRWGKGFVLALSRRWAQPERAYRDWHRDRAGNTFGLGPVRSSRWSRTWGGQHGRPARRQGQRPHAAD